ncbi:MAG: M48 family metalloprotease [Pirellulales bacterium]
MPDEEIHADLEPLPYHFAIRGYLKNEESQIWEWYASNRVRAEQAEEIRFDLLKSTYRIDRKIQPAIYDVADDVAKQLGLAVPTTLYQAQNPQGLNASLAYIPEEAHVILHGPIASRLSEQELRALLAHEFGHLLLYSRWDGDLLIVDQVLAAMSHDRNADTPHFASARLFRLYTEVFCDRIALDVVGSPLDAISMLVKITTDLDEVHAESYLKQAEEILGQGPVKTEGLSHPESYIRAHALQLWHEQGAEANPRITELIEGPTALDELDLTAQVRVMGITRRLIDAMLTPKWLQTEMVLAHARLFFDDYAPADSVVSVEALREEVHQCDQALRDYYCYVLLDFTSADRELEEAPLAHAIGLAEALDLSKEFLSIAAKGLNLRKKQVEKVSADRERIVAAAAKSEAES